MCNGDTFIIIFFLLSRCAILGVDNDTYSVQSQAHAILINNTIPLTDGKWDSCHLLTDDATGITNGTNGTISDVPQSNTSQTEKPCSRWVFDHSVFESTVATDVCFTLDLWCWPHVLQSIWFTDTLKMMTVLKHKANKNNKQANQKKKKKKKNRKKTSCEHLRHLYVSHNQAKRTKD